MAYSGSVNGSVRGRSLSVAAAAVLLVLISTARIRTVEHLSDQGYFDKYLDFASRLSQGRLSADRWSEVSPAYLGVISLLHGSLQLPVESIRRVQIVATVIVAAACGSGAALLAGPLAGVAAAILILGNRAILVNATELEPETLILLLNACAVLFLCIWVRTLRTGFLSACALALGLSAVTRPTAILPLALIALWLLFGRRRQAGLQTRALLAALWVGIGLAPVTALLVGNAVSGRPVTVMDPGTVFYEGMNPSANGYAGVQPRIVNDLERQTTARDALHITYRLVASRALGRALTKEDSNRYWTGKAIAFARSYPRRAAELIGRKILFALKSYDAYDLTTMVRKDWELQRQVWIPFGVVLPLAVLGALMRRDLAAPFVLFALGTAAPLVIFYVTARQRNGLLAPLVVLGGLGCAAMVRSLRGSESRRAIAALAAVIAAGLVFHHDGWRQREDRHAWISSFASQRLLAQARGAEPQRAATLRAHAATWLTTYTVASPSALVTRAAVQEIESATAPERLFDLAVVLGRTGQWRLSAEILERLDAAGYRPVRDTRTASSIAYHRAVNQLGLGHRAAASALLARARGEAPGDPDILALDALLNDPGATALLSKLHDPFTRDLALARAQAQLGQISQTHVLLGRIERQLPEWPAPKELARDLAPR